MYYIIDDEYFKQLYVDFPKDFILKYKQEFNVSNFISIDVKNKIQQIGLEYGLFFSNC